MSDELKTSQSQRRAVERYKQKVKRITVDFYPTEEAEWEHIQSQPNKQGYIKSLIRADMECGYWTFYSSHGEDEYEYKCSKCNDYSNQRYEFCPNCGKRMKIGRA